MGKYLSFAEVALSLISQSGQSITVTRKSPGTFDPITQEETPVITSEAFMGVVFPPSTQAQHKAATLELTFTAEVYFAMLGRSFAPGPGDTFSAAGQAYTIQHSQTYDPAGDGPIMTVAYAV